MKDKGLIPKKPRNIPGPKLGEVNPRLPGEKIPRIRKAKRQDMFEGGAI